MYIKFVKRLLDLLLSFILIAVLAPVMIILMLALSIVNNGKPFFVQPRPGKNERIFKLIKFKTMNDKRDKEGSLLPDVIRLTPLGRFIRTTSIDELPQLFNVLIGNMSLVGPRPLLTRYLSRYNSFQARRHEVKPGITGWTQVNGRNALLWDEKFELDIYYVDHISFMLDLKILLLTVKRVFKREGITSASSATMEEFRGNV